MLVGKLHAKQKCSYMAVDDRVLGFFNDIYFDFLVYCRMRGACFSIIVYRTGKKCRRKQKYDLFIVYLR